MEYTAELLGVRGLEKPKVSYSASVKALREWAKATLETNPSGWVTITRSVPTLVERIRPERGKDGKVVGITIEEVGGE